MSCPLLMPDVLIGVNGLEGSRLTPEEVVKEKCANGFVGCDGTVPCSLVTGGPVVWWLVEDELLCEMLNVAVSFVTMF